MTKNRQTPNPMDPTWIKKFNAAVLSTATKEQQQLASKMAIKYKGSVGKILPLLALNSPTPTPLLLRFTITVSNMPMGICLRNNGIYFYFWHMRTRDKLPTCPLPHINSKIQIFLLDKSPVHDAQTAVTYGDSDWVQWYLFEAING